MRGADATICPMRRHAAALSLLVMLAGFAAAQHPCGEAETSPPCHQGQPAPESTDNGCHPEGSCTHPCHLAAVVAHGPELRIFGSAEPVSPSAAPPRLAAPRDTIDHIPLA